MCDVTLQYSWDDLREFIELRSVISSGREHVFIVGLASLCNPGHAVSELIFITYFITFIHYSIA